MASFRATLSVRNGDFAIDLNELTLDLHQHIDSLGRPASRTHGGTLTATFNTTRHPVITGWMFAPAMQLNGSVTMWDLEGKVLKTITFTNAFCVNMGDRFDGTDSTMQMETTILITPEKISVGHLPHDNEWPPIESE